MELIATIEVCIANYSAFIANYSAFIASYSKGSAPFSCIATADSVLEKLQRLCSQLYYT